MFLSAKRPPSDLPVVGGSAMWDFDSYREFLNEHAGEHHFVGSAFLLVVVVGVLLIAFA
jgi:hypothetical protein